MGYYVQSILTDSKKIKSVFGCKNEVLLTQLIEKLYEELEILNSDFEDQINTSVNAHAVLKDIINGEIRFPKLAFLYGYVYEKLCKYYGETVHPPKNEYVTNYYWAIPKETYKTFIEIPFSNDFPEIYSIYFEDLIKEKERFLNLKELNGFENVDLAIAKQDFEFIFDKAIAEKKDLVFTLY